MANNRTKKSAPKFIPNEGRRNAAHYFASSVASWQTGENLDEIISYMKRDGFPFNLWLVPLHRDAEYKISNYAPQVEGCTFIGFWGFPE